MQSTPTPLLELSLSGLADEEAQDSIWHQHLSAWLQRLQQDLPTHLRASSYSLGLAFCDDAEMAKLNSHWRSQEGPTDVLAFAALDEPFPQPPAPSAPEEDGAESEPLELGDIVICRDTARRQASSYGHSPAQELLFLASHGLLHLLGWDHPDEASLAAMLAKQADLLSDTAHLQQVTTEPCDGESRG